MTDQELITHTEWLCEAGMPRIRHEHLNRLCEICEYKRDREFPAYFDEGDEACLFRLELLRVVKRAKKKLKESS